MAKKRKSDKKGDETSPDTTVNSLAPLIRKIAVARHSKYLTEQECEAVAWIGALKALRSFDASRGAKLSSWVCTKAEYEIKTAETRERKARARCSLYPTWRLYSIESRGGDPAQEDAQTARKDGVTALISEEIEKLDAQTATILRLALFQGKTQREIGDALGISQTWCSRLYREGIKTLRARLGAILER